MIGEIEDALVYACQACLPGVDVASGPFEYDGSYIKKFVTQPPAARIIWAGGEAEDETEFTMGADFRVLVMVGWEGDDENSRRRKVGGAYDVIIALMAALHNLALKKVTRANAGDPWTVTDDTLTRLRVEAVGNLGDGEDDRMGLAIYEITLVCEIELKPADPYKGVAVDWLRVGTTIDLPNEGEGFDPDAGDEIGKDGDFPGTFDLPQ